MLKKIENLIPNQTCMTISLFLLSCSITLAQAQQLLTIDSCYTLAKNNYPLIKQMEILEKAKDYSLDNASKGYLPQFGINGQATYQSAVTALPISLPFIKVPSLSKDQYKIYGEINQPLTDVFTINQQKKLIEANTIVEEQKIEVELYKLKERINNIYFGILLIDAQIQQTELLKKDIQSGLDKTNASINNGVALKSSADLLKAELLKANQRTIELKTTRKGYSEMLGLFINQKMDENTKFLTPIPQKVSENINRPELKLFDAQKKIVDVQNTLITTKNIPRLGLFLNSGYGRPALNMLSNDFEFYYYGGLRLNWNLSGFYTFKKEKQLLTLNQNSFDIQNETFLFSTRLSMTQQNSEINKFQELITTDNEIIALREKIKSTSKSQLENGTTTTIDYMTYVNAEDQAKQNLLLHQIQLLIAQYNYQTTSGN